MVTSHRSSLLRRPSRPLLDPLEERILLNARFIVPVGVPVNNTSTFTDLQTALTTPGLGIGDTVQIEPGSSPGNVTLTAPPVNNLTIQGDPNAALATIPQFTFSNMFTVAAVQGTVTFKNLNLGFITQGFAAAFGTNGGLRGTGNYTISNCNIIDINSNLAYPLGLSGVTNTITNSTFTDITGVDAFINFITPAGGSNNLIAKNTFVINVGTTTNNGAIVYFGGANVLVSDQILSNNFLSNVGANSTAFCAVSEGITGLIIQGNIFSSLSPATGVLQNAAAQNLIINNNTFNFGPTSTVLEFNAQGAGSTVSATVANNIINTGAGIGVQIALSTTTSFINLKFQGNDFHANKIGVKIISTGAASYITGLDFGGGSQASLGGNDFRGFTTPTNASAAFYLINVIGDPNAIKAQKNLFALGINQQTTLNDANANMSFANPLSPNAAFVQSLYENYLHRTGDTTNPADAAFWVNALTADTMTAAQVANSIIHSPESLAALVDGLYQRFLGRATDSAGQAYFAGILQKPQGVETVILQFLTSAEFTAQFSNDGNFIQAIYTRLLGRIASNADVAYWLTTLPTTGRAGVITGILASAEFRTSILQQFYGFTPAPSVAAASIFPPVLHRILAPTAPEISYWLSTTLDLLTLNTAFAQTSEYYNFG